MKNKVLWGAAAVLIVLGLVVAFVLFRLAPADGPGQSNTATDPQMLLIPRWFLRDMTVNGKSYDLPEQGITMQFEPGGQANGQGGCNGFGVTYEAGTDGKMKFGPVTSTMMACDQGMDREQAYFTALAQVANYAFANGNVTLSSMDGKTVLVFGKPPK